MFMGNNWKSQESTIKNAAQFLTRDNRCQPFCLSRSKVTLTVMKLMWHFAVLVLSSALFYYIFILFFPFVCVCTCKSEAKRS